MIRGYFSPVGRGRQPFVSAFVTCPGVGNGKTLRVELVVDTGADVTLIGPHDAIRLARTLQIPLQQQPLGIPITGFGGQAPTRLLPAVVDLGGFPISYPQLMVSEPLPPHLQHLPIPSVLGRDAIRRFTLIMDEANDRVVLLEPREAAQLRLNGHPLP